MTLFLRRALFAILLFTVLFFILRHTDVFPSLNNIFKPNAVVVDETPLLVNEIRTIAQLMTIEAFNEVVVDSTHYPLGVSPRIFNSIPGNLLGLLGTSQLVLIVRGKVVAGVDLQMFDSSHINVHNDSVFIQLPRATILEVITNPSDVETFVEKGKWNEAAATALKVKARRKIVQQAVAQGALQQADARARQLVYELLKNAGYKHVAVTTTIHIQAPSGKQ